MAKGLVCLLLNIVATSLPIFGECVKNIGGCTKRKPVPVAGICAHINLEQKTTIFLAFNKLIYFSPKFSRNGHQRWVSTEERDF